MRGEVTTDQGLVEKETETHPFQISVHDLKGVQI